MVLGALNNMEWKMDLNRKAERDEMETAAVEPETGNAVWIQQDREWKMEWDGNRMDYDGKWDGKGNGNKYERHVE